MTMRFRYLQVHMGKPLVSLGGRPTRPRTILGVTVLSPTTSRSLDALLDTGADDTVFSEQLAQRLGIDLSTAEVGTAQGAGGQLITVRYATVRLRIADQQEQREWEAVVGFAPLGQTSLPMLGFAGFLQYFTAVFYGDREEVELTVNSLYSGT
jgi:predicted aspartyl protease